MEKLTVNQGPWFGTTDFKGRNQLSPASDISLRSSRLLYPLPLPLELLLFIVPLALAVLPFISANPMRSEAWIALNLGAILGYLLLRKLSINGSYGNADSHVCQISHRRLIIPGSRLVGAQAGPIPLERHAIKRIDVYFWPSTRDLRTSYDVSELSIILQSGRSIRLKGIYFPIKPLLYLLVYFDYPLTLHKRRPPLSIVARSLFVAFPLVALVAVTGLLIKEHFL
ncbi:hypothetical protein FCL40_03140 [Ferrimonas sediminicola]|uniref:Uncharacterized protein n=1 Tax=Ferrimonas sediminicola TaxID=2569538 RepID=A0A4U1BK44_9GAMM|nr:hypothetical protein [Ferrimonas sediminicola]TKB51565.1 hypothetical protein FCL40_03140 [Ferrimonas sediminicola]